MSTIPVPGTRPERLPIAPKGASAGRSTGWWGMVLLIFTEATFFAVLLMSYFYLRFQNGAVWPPEGIEKPPLFLISIMTPILLLSSIPAHVADRAIRKGRVGLMRLGLAAVFLQGLAFILLQCKEYLDSVKEFTPQTNAYGSLFYTITGFHGVHVTVGLILMLWLLVYSFRGRWTADDHGPVATIILYWHFVDAVWIFIFVSLYISPHWWP